jgi:hypothetical protein
MARLRTPLAAASFLALASCDHRQLATEPGSGPEAAPSPLPSFAVAYSGGIPFGLYNMPTTLIGGDFNAKMTNARLWLPQLTRPTNIMLSELSAIKSRGGKVILNLVGGHPNYLDANGRFSMTKWKQRVDAFKSIKFGSYVRDGTVIAHHVIDEPNDPSNWGGVPIPPATVEEMARYSKQLWPNMPTVARVESSYLAKWTGSYVYLDGAWAQWVARKGDPGEFITRNVADAKRKGLSLITGLNILKGDFREPLSPSLIKSAGSALLTSFYPCAFISWQYDVEYLASPGVRDALRFLRAKALNRPYKSCGT